MPHVKQTTLALRSCEPRSPPHTQRTPPYVYRPTVGYNGCGVFSQIGGAFHECYRDGITIAQAQQCLIWQCLYFDPIFNWWTCTYYDLYHPVVYQANTSWPDCEPIVWFDIGFPPPDVCRQLPLWYPECECPFGP